MKLKYPIVSILLLVLILGTVMPAVGQAQAPTNTNGQAGVQSHADAQTPVQTPERVYNTYTRTDARTPVHNVQEGVPMQAGTTNTSSNTSAGSGGQADESGQACTDDTGALTPASVSTCARNGVDITENEAQQIYQYYTAQIGNFDDSNREIVDSWVTAELTGQDTQPVGNEKPEGEQWDSVIKEFPSGLQVHEVELDYDNSTASVYLSSDSRISEVVITDSTRETTGVIPQERFSIDVREYKTVEIELTNIDKEALTVQPSGGELWLWVGEPSGDLGSAINNLISPAHVLGASITGSIAVTVFIFIRYRYRQFKRQINIAKRWF